MLNTWRKSEKSRKAAAGLHAAIVSRARAPVFYAELGVADSLDGRFDLIALHAWMVLERLGQAGLGDVSQALTDALFIGFDEGMRDLGAGDMGMGRKMKAFGNAFYGRMKAYGECTGEAEMQVALERNLYRASPSAHAARVARYVLSAREHLKAADPAAGMADFGPLP
jgi:cytochrome b pre-mRNA-processing protein 3